MHAHASRLGIASPRFLSETVTFAAQIDAELQRLERTGVAHATQAELLKRPGSSYESLPIARTDLDAEVRRQIEIRLKYDGYIARELRQAARAIELEHQAIPREMDFWTIPALKHESKEKLSRIRPASIGQASRISGISPADIAILSIAIRKKGMQRDVDT
jgi:tRNA uridine 5-carboxymethylaminomethyl modification enzyme